MYIDCTFPANYLTFSRSVDRDGGLQPSPRLPHDVQVDLPVRRRPVLHRQARDAKPGPALQRRD